MDSQGRQAHIPDFGWTLRDINSAHARVTLLPNGKTRIEIEHKPVAGVTAEMLDWWYAHFCDVDVKVRGSILAAFILAHPLDHIGTKRVTGTSGMPLQSGDVLHLIESFQGDPKNTIDEYLHIETVKRGIFSVRVLQQGNVLAESDYVFSDSPEGAVVVNTVDVGATPNILKSILNRKPTPWILKHDRDLAWIRHSVEEVGCFENFLPTLFSRRAQGATVSLDL